MSYGAPPPGQMPPAGGYGAGPIDHPKGTTILVLGILSLVCCSPLGIAAFVMGNSALKEIDANPGMYSNRGAVNAGRICGIIGMVFMVISIIAWVFLLSTGNATFTAGTTTS